MKPLATLLKTIAFGLGAVLSVGDVQGQLVLSGDVNTGLTLTLQQDEVFNITSPNTFRALLFDDWATSDGSLNLALSAFPQNAEFSINNGPYFPVRVNFLVDNVALSGGGFISGDGGLFFDSLTSVNAGDVVRLKAGSWTFQGNPDFNPATVGTFSGTVAMVGPLNATALLLGAVPEPMEYTLVSGAGLAGWVMWRRRSARRGPARLRDGTTGSR